MIQMYQLKKSSEGWLILNQENQIHQNYYQSKVKASDVRNKISEGLIKFIPYGADTRKSF